MKQIKQLLQFIGLVFLGVFVWMIGFLIFIKFIKIITPLINNL